MPLRRLEKAERYSLKESGIDALTPVFKKSNVFNDIINALRTNQALAE